MVYFPVHKRKVMGNQIHETLTEKKSKVKDKEEELEQIDSSLSKIRKEIEKEKVESEYLTPEVKNWVETEPRQLKKG